MDPMNPSASCPLSFFLSVRLPTKCAASAAPGSCKFLDMSIFALNILGQMHERREATKEQIGVQEEVRACPVEPPRSVFILSSSASESTNSLDPLQILEKIREREERRPRVEACGGVVCLSFVLQIFSRL